MNRDTKRVLTIAATVIGAVALSFIIGFSPSCSGGNDTTLNSPVTNPAETDSQVSEAPTGTDYESMSKDELLAVIEERDAQIDELVNKVEELTILAKQTTNSIVVPTPSTSGSNDSSDDDDDEDSSTSSGNSSSGSSSSSGNSSSGNSSSGSSSSSSGSSSSGSGNTSDTGL